MRIDQTSNAALVWREPTGPRRDQRPAPRPVSAPLPAAAELARKPRFAMLIGLMERLTGREVKLVPPATMMIGPRKQATPADAPLAVGESGRLHVRSVRATPDGEAYRVTATHRAADRSSRAVELDLDRSVVDHHVLAHARGSARDAGPLNVAVDMRAVAAPPGARLHVAPAGDDAVAVTAAAPEIDVDA